MSVHKCRLQFTRWSLGLNMLSLKNGKNNSVRMNVKILRGKAPDIDRPDRAVARSFVRMILSVL